MRKINGAWMMAVAAALAFAACSSTRTLMSSGGTGQTWTMSAGPKVPGAEGKVRAAAGGDGNQTVDVEVKHLTPANLIYKGMSHYVVWLQPHGGGPAQNIGVLNVGEDRDAHLTTKTPFKDFDVIVTAEESANATQPSGRGVLHATIHVAT
jgi:hypothetical protein